MAQRDRNDRHSAPAAGTLNRRGTALGAGLFLFLATSFAYAGPSWVMLTYHGVVEGAHLALWLLGAAGLGATVLRWSRVDEGLAARNVTAVALGLGTLSLIVLGLGLAGWLSRAVAFAVLVLGGAPAAVRLYRDGQQVGERLRAWLRAPAGWAWLWLAVVPLAAVAFVGSAVPPGMLWHPDEPHGYDVIEYHLQIPREWYEAGRIVPLRHNVFCYFPFNVEAHYLLAMHLRGGPWAGMYLAQLMHGAHFVLAVVAVHGLARSLGAGAAGAAVASVLAASVPWLALLAPMGYNEGGLLLYGTLAVGHALRAALNNSPVRTSALAGAFAGFACGTKLTAVPTVLLLVPLVTVVGALLDRRALRPILLGCAMFVVAGAVTFAPWLARNAAWAGNPVFPQAAGLLGAAHFTPVQVERWERAHAPPAGKDTVVESFRAIGRQVGIDWRFGYVLLPGALLATWAARNRRGWWELLALLMGNAGFWLFFTHHQGRFFVQAVPIAALLLALVEWRGRRWPVAGAALGVASSLLGWGLVHWQFAPRMYGELPWVRLLTLPGEELVQMHPPEVAALPPEATLSLIGDARAFWYPRPMALLRYRTVFDVNAPEGANSVEAWRAGWPPVANEWQLIHPGELERFARTYWGIPEPPADVKAHRGAYVVPGPAR